ncbi:hypothetical protein ISS86_02085 [Candidatus Microgenomates bacterium]|nr:hypothetical protein [Candidatus Microgenomates bacterium]
MRFKKILFYLYLLLIALLSLVMFFNPESRLLGITRVIIILCLASFLGLYHFLLKGRRFSVGVGKFIFLTWISAMIVEAAFMISDPVDMSVLVVVGETPTVQAIKNTLIDFLITTPAYVTTALVFWMFLKKYSYSTFEFIIFSTLVGLFGDSINIWFSPGYWIFFPAFTFLYHAIFLPAFLLAKGSLGTNQTSWRKKTLMSVAGVVVYQSYIFNFFLGVVVSLITIAVYFLKFKKQPSMGKEK